uniref:DRBM domain-containing protein n=1 Tax=Rhabditophanes sp. KR3021 TaxID=114890 RepID=A0AC35TU21_9BILA
MGNRSSSKSKETIVSQVKDFVNNQFPGERNLIIYQDQRMPKAKTGYKIVCTFRFHTTVGENYTRIKAKEDAAYEMLSLLKDTYTPKPDFAEFTTKLNDMAKIISLKKPGKVEYLFKYKSDSNQSWHEVKCKYLGFVATGISYKKAETEGMAAKKMIELVEESYDWRECFEISQILFEEMVKVISLKNPGEPVFAFTACKYYKKDGYECKCNYLSFESKSNAMTKEEAECICIIKMMALLNSKLNWRKNYNIYKVRLQETIDFVSQLYPGELEYDVSTEERDKQLWYTAKCRYLSYETTGVEHQRCEAEGIAARKMMEILHIHANTTNISHQSFDIEEIESEAAEFYSIVNSKVCQIECDNEIEFAPMNVYSSY